MSEQFYNNSVESKLETSLESPTKLINQFEIESTPVKLMREAELIIGEE